MDQQEGRRLLGPQPPVDPTHLWALAPGTHLGKMPQSQWEGRPRSHDETGQRALHQVTAQV